MLTGERPLDRQGVIEMKHPLVQEELKEVICKCLHIEKKLGHEKTETLKISIKKCTEKKALGLLGILIIMILFVSGKITEASEKVSHYERIITVKSIEESRASIQSSCYKRIKKNISEKGRYKYKKQLKQEELLAEIERDYYGRKVLKKKYK